MSIRSAEGPADILTVLCGHAERQPDAVAYRFLLEGEADGPLVTCTYAQLRSQVGAVATHLRSVTQPGDRVLLLYPPGLDFMLGFLGTLAAGCVAVPAYPPNPTRLARELPRLQQIAADCGAQLVLTVEAVRGLALPLLADVPALAHAHWVASDRIDGSGEVVPAALESAAFIQYTSGSTATPRGVVVSHANLIANQRAIREGMRHDRDSHFVGWLPLYHDMGLVGNALHPLFLGSSSTLMAPEAFLQRPTRWLHAITRFAAHTSGGPNFAFELCARKATREDLEALDLRAWRVAFNGAEPIRAASLERFGQVFAPAGFSEDAFFPCYGLAEATLYVTGRGHGARRVLSVDARALETEGLACAPNGQDEPRARQLVGCGHASGDERVRIVDPDTQRALPDGRVGEIWVRGSSVAAAGYWGKPELTLATFGAHTSDGEGPFLRTGDLGVLDQGALFVTGRSKDVIIVRGRCHYPQDLEHAVEACTGVKPGGVAAAAVHSPEREAEGLVIVAEHDLRDATTAACSALIAAIREAVRDASGLVAQSIALIPPRALPKTSSGKVRRGAAAQGLEAGTLELVARWDAPAAREPESRPSSAPASSSHDERTLLHVLRGELAALTGTSLEDIDPRNSLSALGIDSARAVELSATLAERLGRPVSPTLFWDYPDLTSLARQLTVGERRAKVAERAGAAPSEIAIIAMACRFPGAETPEAFWQLLQEGRELITEVPRQRFAIDEVFDAIPGTPGKTYSRWGGFLEGSEGIERFDAAFFGISPREAPGIDPQQRLLLEVAWEACERAGLTREALSDSNTGVYVGMSGSEYQQRVLTDLQRIDPWTLTGTTASAQVGRLSYWLGLRGPSLAVDAACSSSLLALHLACRGLRDGECDLAFAGGVNLLLSAAGFVGMSQLRALSPTGRCSAFSASADGYVRAEGCGVVLLKRLADAERDGDDVIAVIRGSAVNQDGASNGFTAPRGPAQEAVIAAALRDAGVAARSIDCVECHGTGTPLGDPIEAQALGAALGTEREPDEPVLIGSVKSNIGHTEAAAGIASVIKMALALRAGSIPASVHVAAQGLSPHVAWSELRLRVVDAPQAWPTRGPSSSHPRRGGVSAFSFHGTNVHVVMEQAKAASPASGPAATALPVVPLLLSGHGTEALRANAAKLASQLAEDVSLAELGAALATRRTHHSHRAVILVDGALPREALHALQSLVAGDARILGEARHGAGLGLFFAGQGALRPACGQQLRALPAFRTAFDAACDALRPGLDMPLQDAMLAPAGSALARRLERTDWAQAATFAHGVGLAALSTAFGLAPLALFGHSLGELTALHAAGVLSLDDAARLVTRRGAIMRALPAGAMAAIRGSHDQVRALAEATGVDVAALNAIDTMVVAGSPDQIAECTRAATAAGLTARLLPVAHAFHSRHLDPLLAQLDALGAGLTLRAPKVPVLSGTTGRELTRDELAAPGFWSRQARAPVQMAAAMRAMRELGVTCLLELAPSRVLSPLAERDAARAGSSLQARAVCDASAPSELHGWLQALGFAHVHGVEVDFRAAFRPYTGRRASLPSYAFQRQRHWIDAAPTFAPLAPARGRMTDPSDKPSGSKLALRPLRDDARPPPSAPERSAATAPAALDASAELMELYRFQRRRLDHLASLELRDGRRDDGMLQELQAARELLAMLQSGAGGVPRSEGNAPAAERAIASEPAGAVGALVDRISRLAGAALLLPAPLGPDQHFREVGMDSIVASELARDLGRQFSITMHARELYEHPTPRALARVLEQRQLGQVAKLAETAKAPAVAAASEEEALDDRYRRAFAGIRGLRIEQLALATGASVEVFVAGDARRSVLLLPGMGLPSVYRYQLADRHPSLRLVSLNYPGMGRTPAQSGADLASLAELAEQTLTGLGHDGEVDVVGFSFGTLVAQLFAIAHPERVRSLTLVCGTPFLKPGDARPKDLVREFERDLPGTRAASDGFVWDLLRGGIMPAAIALDLRSRLAEIGAPTTVICGGRDTICPVERSQLMASTIPDARLHIIPEAGHYLPLFQPEALTAVLADGVAVDG